MLLKLVNEFFKDKVKTIQQKNEDYEILVCFNEKPSEQELRMFCNIAGVYGKQFDKDLFKDCWIKFRKILYGLSLIEHTGCKDCLYYSTSREKRGNGYRFYNVCLLQPGILGVDCCNGDLITKKVLL